jgi:mRNA-degrading endonuclease YafQ of YafQ-DinJ toxin-antitoxin module
MNLAVRKHNANRYRSGLERVVAEFLKQNKKNFRYEDLKIEWKDLRYRTYTPDFILDNGIIVETKGIFDNEDRRKHLAVREQHPELDIRLVFSNAKAKLYKGSKTTYAMWCDKNEFLYSHRVIPPDWLEEKGKAVKTKRVKLKVGT